MSKYYTAQRKSSMYEPDSKKPFKLSWSQINLYRDCPRCFYIDRKLGTGRPGGMPFTLNMAVDTLMKKEFDNYRVQELPHPVIFDNIGMGTIPACHENLDDWRNNRKGIQFLHEPTNMLITGAIDDLWIDREGKYHVVDYKATAKKDDITELPADYGYKEQMEVYQWLLRKNSLDVSDTGYFLYCNGDAENYPALNNSLNFRMTLIECKGNDSWVEPTIIKIHKCLNSSTIPDASKDCDFCAYVNAYNDHFSLPVTER